MASRHRKVAKKKEVANDGNLQGNETEMKNYDFNIPPFLFLLPFLG